MYVLTANNSGDQTSSPIKRITGLKITPSNGRCDGFSITMKGKEKVIDYKE
jgi:hypothetical protein